MNHRGRRGTGVREEGFSLCALWTLCFEDAVGLYVLGGMNHRALCLLLIGGMNHRAHRDHRDCST